MKTTNTKDAYAIVWALPCTARTAMARWLTAEADGLDARGLYGSATLRNMALACHAGVVRQKKPAGRNR
jgi:hypothetical protein